MERTTPEGYLNRKETAERLNISLRHLNTLVRRGLLQPQRVLNATKMFFHQSEIEHLTLARSEKELDLRGVKTLALQALSSVRVLERRIAELYNVMGLSAEPLERDTAAIRTLALQLENGVVDDQLRDPPWVKSWASTFFSMDVLYFQLVRDALGDDEPWKRYIDFANRLKAAGYKQVHEAIKYSDILAHAYKYLHAASRHLTHEGFIYCRQLHGRRIADQVFHEGTEAVDELEALLR
jgi:DNA-binding transcriptional MerR regulator